MTDGHFKKIKELTDIDLGDKIEAYLQEKLPGIFQILSKKINIKEVIAASGSIKDIAVDKILMGDATIDKIILKGTSANIKSGSAFLQNVRINLELKLTLEWWYDIWIHSDSGTENLGSLWFPLQLGNVQVPSLEDINLSVPNVVIDNLTTGISPINNLDLGSGNFSQIDATDTTLPVNGFQLTGLGLGNFNLSQIQVPKTSTQKATIQQFKPANNIVLPEAQINNLNIPETSINNIQSANISLDGSASKKGINVNLGVLGFKFWVEPVAHINIASMTLQDVKLNAIINMANIEDISIPIDIRGITVKGVDINNIDINDISG